MPAGALEAMLRREGARAERIPGDGGVERRGIDWSADVQMTVSAIVATGSVAAIGAAVAAFRKRFPKATVKVDAEPDDGGFLDS
jgi:hypothetical protein